MYKEKESTMHLSWKIALMILVAFLVILLFMITASRAEWTCEKGFVLEQKDGKYNCRNPLCDAGFNFYGDAIDNNKPILTFLLLDKDGKVRPKVKGPDGNWVGWTIGAYQCPPDPLGVHPNPDYVFDNTTPINVPKNLRIANMKAIWSSKLYLKNNLKPKTI